MLEMSGDKIGKIERGELATFSFTDAAQIGAVLGLDLSARFYPNGAVVRDAGQATKLVRLIEHVSLPLHSRTDVPLPQRPSQPRELRAWDCVVWDRTARSAFEFESRITDFQAMTRRHALKRRDDPVDHFVLAVADSAHNRRALQELGSLITDLPRLRTATVLRLLESGRHPPTGFMFF
jgi:hypothetical protein